jgi:hypothetical protein
MLMRSPQPGETWAQPGSGIPAAPRPPIGHIPEASPAYFGEAYIVICVSRHQHGSRLACLLSARQAVAHWWPDRRVRRSRSQAVCGPEELVDLPAPGRWLRQDLRARRAQAVEEYADVAAGQVRHGAAIRCVG